MNGRPTKTDSRASVIRLMGGLGNQMFQYALGRRISSEQGGPVVFDLVNGFRDDPFGRTFALGDFNAEVAAARSQEIPIGMGWGLPWIRLAKAGRSLLPAARRRIIYDRIPYQFDPAALVADGPAYYFGYWQNERYFSPVEGDLRKDFTLRAAALASIAPLIAETGACRSVSLHVRRNLGLGADGRPVRKAQEAYMACTVDYYHKALEAVGREPGTVCYVFADDPAWAKANLKLPVPCRHVSDLCRCSDSAELALMASCKHHIISNSSFSWWGAWLGGNAGKVVVAPREWARGFPASMLDWCPAAWIRL
jgi:hypothetical protein